MILLKQSMNNLPNIYPERAFHHCQPQGHTFIIGLGIVSEGARCFFTYDPVQGQQVNWKNDSDNQGQGAGRALPKLHQMQHFVKQGLFQARSALDKYIATIWFG